MIMLFREISPKQPLTPDVIGCPTMYIGRWRKNMIMLFTEISPKQPLINRSESFQNNQESSVAGKLSPMVVEGGGAFAGGHWR